MVEQGTHKPLVGGSNPPSATNARPTTFGHCRPGSSDFPIAVPPPSAARRRPYPDSGTRPSVSGTSIGAGRYTRTQRSTHGRRRSTRRLRLNAKFFRNGIVMLVLVVGHRALLFTWLIQPTRRKPRRLFPVPRRRRRRARSPAVTQQGDDPDRQRQRTDRDLHGHRPERPDPRSMQRHAGRRQGRQRHRRRRRLSRPSRRPTRRGSGCC